MAKTLFNVYIYSVLLLLLLLMIIGFILQVSVTLPVMTILHFPLQIYAKPST